MHAGLHDPSAAVLVAIDTAAESMAIVTGSRVHRTLDDRTCEFALLTLRSSLQVGDLVGGVRDAVMLLAEHARAPRTLHLDEPV
jgi:ABC-type cobalamin/Fe3+-siderophores transport system ATPase subunit